MRAKVAVGLVRVLCDGLAERYELSRAACLAHAGLQPEQLADPEGMVELRGLIALLRFARARTRDPGLGLALARTWDLRQQGFWGYALLSSTTLRERLEGHLRYQPLRSPFSLMLNEEPNFVTLSISTFDMPEDVRPLLIDWAVGTSLLHLHEHLTRVAGAASEMQLWLNYPEQPHHSRLRALFAGDIVFDAACVRWQMPAKWLDFKLQGDPYLGRLARGQLDARLPEKCPPSAEHLVPRVRERIAARLARDASLARVARDLGIGARTLQRQLEALGASFHALTDEVRRSQALRSIGETEQALSQLAAQLGYADTASFRRAFRRWTGVSPVRYRQAQRTGAMPRLTRDAHPGTRKVSGRHAG